MRETNLFGCTNWNFSFHKSQILPTSHKGLHQVKILGVDPRIYVVISIGNDKKPGFIFGAPLFAPKSSYFLNCIMASSVLVVSLICCSIEHTTDLSKPHRGSHGTQRLQHLFEFLALRTLLAKIGVHPTNSQLTHSKREADGW